jgi:hypothetical protein
VVHQTFGELAWNQGADADQSVSGYLQLFNPSSNVFVKHFIGSFNQVATNLIIQ